MTTGNAAATRRRSPSMEEQLIEATLELIAEEGGSLAVNLRQVSRRVGCAHTNVYNYFDSYRDLQWAAFRRALRRYADHLIEGLDASMPAYEYLRRAVGNLASFPQQNPGLYRFIGSDPLDLDTIPADIMSTVTTMKRWLAATVEAAAGPGVSPADARHIADIVLAYIDGETLNLINGRSIPDEDLGGRVVANAMRLFELLVADASPRRSSRSATGVPPDPASILGVDAAETV
ncbi:MAG: TetR/AcrR family transcriptional regulator [Chloroflexota bacterium]